MFLSAYAQGPGSGGRLGYLVMADYSWALQIIVWLVRPVES